MCWMDWCEGEIIERQLFMIADLRGVGLFKISDGYLGPVLYARTRADPKSRLNSYMKRLIIFVVNL